MTKYTIRIQNNLDIPRKYYVAHLFDWVDEQDVYAVTPELEPRIGTATFEISYEYYVVKAKLVPSSGDQGYAMRTEQAVLPPPLSPDGSINFSVKRMRDMFHHRSEDEHGRQPFKPGKREKAADGCLYFYGLGLPSPHDPNVIVPFWTMASWREEEMKIKPRPRFFVGTLDDLDINVGGGFTCDRPQYSNCPQVTVDFSNGMTRAMVIQTELDYPELDPNVSDSDASIPWSDQFGPAYKVMYSA